MRASPEDLLSGPFTPAMAARRGIGRAALERMVREQQVVRLTRGVYLAAGLTAGTAVRAEALRLVISSRTTVTGRTAAWLHGCAAEALLVGLEQGRGIPVELRASRALGAPQATVLLDGVRTATAPVVASNLACRLRPAAALAALDGLVRCGALAQRDLFAAARRPGETELTTELAARCDGRADGPVESVLRLHWLDARLPTPCPGLVVGVDRVALGLPTHRFAVVIAGRSTPGAQDRWRAAGWQVIPLNGDQVLATEAALVRAHLEREFHQHLLAQVEASA